MTRISQRARNAAPSPTLGITARFKAMQAQGIDVKDRGRVPAGLVVKFKAATGN